MKSSLQVKADLLDSFKRKQSIMKIFLGADHRGFELKEKVKDYLFGRGYDVSDLGADSYAALDDFVDYAKKVVLSMRKAKGKALGILFCGSGHGMDMVANRYSKIRSIVGFNQKVVIQGREHEDANILSLPAEWVSDGEALVMVELFLKTEFSGKDKYRMRLEKLEKIEAA